jgi:hypothetical protein
MKKISKYFEKINFIDPKTKVVMIVCERIMECRPPKTLEEIRDYGADLIYNYEVIEWNLKQSQNDFIEEGNDTGEWISVIEERFKLEQLVSKNYNVRVRFEDDSLGEIASDKIWF